MDGHVILALFCLILIFVAVSDLSKYYPNEVYVIWYVFCFFFLVFFALYFVAEKKGKQIAEVLGPDFVKAMENILKMLTNVEDEFVLVGVIVYLGIAPQLLTYVLSGISGSATAPIYVRQIGLVAVWSVIKFLAGLSGILLAQPAAKVAIGATVTDDLFQDLIAVLRGAPPDEFYRGLIAIAFAFWLAVLQHAFFDRGFEVPIGLGGTRVGFHVPWLIKIHEWFTRYRQPAGEDDVKVDVVKDAAIVAAASAATAAAAVLRDPSADISTIAQKVVKGVVAIEAATRAEPEKAAAAALAAEKSEHEWVLPLLVATLRFRGGIVDKLAERRRLREVEAAPRQTGSYPK